MTLTKCLIFIVLVTTAMGIGATQLEYGEQQARAFSDPTHCDRDGCPSCYQTGYSRGEYDANNSIVLS
jgi:hypothetical protein